MYEQVSVAYGRAGLTLAMPRGRTTVIEPAYRPGIPDERGALSNALRQPIESRPLRELVPSSARVAIAICDVTRPIPSRRILPVLLGELDHVAEERILILVATGTHRESTRDELVRMVGEPILARYRVEDHRCDDEDQLVDLGRTDRGTPIWLDRRWIETDVRVTTGFVEPHFFAGFSGGPKLVAPGLAGLETVLELHGPELIAHPSSTWGELEGNPVQSEICEIARRTGVTFSLDVSINRTRDITGVFAGELFAAHRAACRSVRKVAMQPVENEFEVVVTTNSGYPLDLNLYQSVKGMSAAARIVRRGGTIVCVTECSDGIPDHGCYGEMLAQCSSPEEVLRLVMQPGFRRQDQWQAQLQAQIQQRAEVYVHSGCLSDDAIRRALVRPVRDVTALIEEKLDRAGPHARVCVLPEGPQTIPYLTGLANSTGES